MSGNSWHVRFNRSLEASFETLAEAERHAKRSVRANGEPREIWRAATGSRPEPFFGASKVVASVRRDAFGRVWVDVLEPTLA